MESGSFDTLLERTRFAVPELLELNAATAQPIVLTFRSERHERMVVNGCTFVRYGKGDHDIWYSPISGQHVTVDTKMKSRHTAKAILRQSGVDYKF